MRTLNRKRTVDQESAQDVSKEYLRKQLLKLQVIIGNRFTNDAEMQSNAQKVQEGLRGFPQIYKELDVLLSDVQMLRECGKIRIESMLQETGAKASGIPRVLENHSACIGGSVSFQAFVQTDSYSPREDIKGKLPKLTQVQRPLMIKPTYFNTFPHKQRQQSLTLKPVSIKRPQMHSELTQLVDLQLPPASTHFLSDTDESLNLDQGEIDTCRYASQTMRDRIQTLRSQHQTLISQVQHLRASLESMRQQLNEMKRSTKQFDQGITEISARLIFLTHWRGVDGALKRRNPRPNFPDLDAVCRALDSMCAANSSEDPGYIYRVRQTASQMLQQPTLADEIIGFRPRQGSLLKIYLRSVWANELERDLCIRLATLLGTEVRFKGAVRVPEFTGLLLNDPGNQWPTQSQMIAACLILEIYRGK